MANCPIRDGTVPKIDSCLATRAAAAAEIVSRALIAARIFSVRTVR